MSDSDEDSIDLSNFPGLEQALTEARRRFDNEESRRDNIERKIGIVVTVDALLISLGSLFLESGEELLSAVTLTPALLSALVGLIVIRPKNYKNPLRDPSEYYSYAGFEEEELHDKFLLSYMSAIQFNGKLNRLKVSFLNLCNVLTFTTLLLILANPILSGDEILVISLFLIPLVFSEGTISESIFFLSNFSQLF